MFKTKVDCILIDDKGICLDFRRLQKVGAQLKDKMAGKLYSIATKPVRVSRNGGKKEKLAYLVDETAGVTVELQPGKNYLQGNDNGKIFELRTDPYLAAKVVDSGILQDAFNIRASYKALVIVAIACLFVGFFGGAIFL